MPPKAAAKDSVDNAIKNLLDNPENPSESDYKVLLSAAKSADNQQKKQAASYIPSYFDKFPKKLKESLAAVLDLAKSDDEQVRVLAIRCLSKFYDIDKSQVGDALINALGDESELIAKNASETVVRYLTNDDQFKQIFFDCLPKAKSQAQHHMVGLIRDNLTFTEENVEQLLDVLKVAFKSYPVGGLALYSKNRSLIKEEQFQPLVDDLFKRLDNSLQKEQDIKDVSEELLVPLFKFTKTLGNSATTRLLSIIADHVIPHFDLLETPKQIEVIRKIANVAQYSDSEKLLEEIYNHIFLNFPTENSGPINFSIIEATLFAFIALARKFNNTASRLIGTTLCYTGQPGEADEANEDEEKNAAFRKRIEYISSVAPSFVDTYDGKIQTYKNQEAKTEQEKEEQREHIKEAKIAKRTGNNVRHLTRLLLSNNPLSGKLPETPSWKRPKNDKRYGSNRRDQRNGRGRSSRYNRNDNRDNNRSRNGGRFNNNNNRQRRSTFRRNDRRWRTSSFLYIF